jgi:hypothetical protein
LAFHPYPQVIPAVCKPPGFGPPRACSARFTLPMGSSPGFGSIGRDSGALTRTPPCRTRLRSGSGSHPLSLATPTHSSAHSTKGTPSPSGSPPGSDRPEAHDFRRSFTPLTGVLFTVPSRYWFTIGRWRSLALDRGRPSFPPAVTWPAVLTQAWHPPPCTVAYGALTPSGRPFQDRSAAAKRRGEPTAVRSPRPVQPRGGIAGRLYHRRGLGCAPFARRY